MTSHLIWSFRFLAPWFHGRGDEGVPEWPPSPLRAFQAVVAAAGRSGQLEATREALCWLERMPPPRVFAPVANTIATGYRLSVPHNSMDLVGKQWCKGEEGTAAEHRTMKNVRPIALPEGAAVHYVWQVEGRSSVLAPLFAAVRGVASLGWGIDLVVGNCQVIRVDQLTSLGDALKVWVPRRGGATELRTAVPGTLDDLDTRHAAFQARTSFADPTLRPPPPLSKYAITQYSRTDATNPVPVACFTLMRTDIDGLRSFDPARSGMIVAGMLRHAVRTAAERAGWPEERVRGTVLGHGEPVNCEAMVPRFMLVPLPSLEPRESGGEVAGAIRRVLIFSTGTNSPDTAWAQRALGGMDLIDQDTGSAQAVLAAAPPTDRVLKRYLMESRTWTTVTPLVLPGHDDPGKLRRKLRATTDAAEQQALLLRLHDRREGLIRKALRHAGLPDDLAHSATIESSGAGFIAGVEHASRYAVPSHLTDSARVHVKLSLPRPIPGPLCLGRGRFSGMGLFVSGA